jgi:hypothetical protein
VSGVLEPARFTAGKHALTHDASTETPHARRHYLHRRAAYTCTILALTTAIDQRGSTHACRCRALPLPADCPHSSEAGQQGEVAAQLAASCWAVAGSGEPNRSILKEDSVAPTTLSPDTPGGCAQDLQGDSC